jgi:hypothetical protein
MQLLGLSEVSGGSLPASRFPEHANTYFCDKCGEDITRHFSARRCHGSLPLGPPTFYCECGERYLSGTREWDHLGSNEKRTSLGVLRITALFAFPFILSLAAAALGIYEHSKRLTTAGTILTVITFPCSVVLAPCFLQLRDIAASIYRTRISNRLPR